MILDISKKKYLIMKIKVKSPKFIKLRYKIGMFFIKISSFFLKEIEIKVEEAL